MQHTGTHGHLYAIISATEHGGFLGPHPQVLQLLQPPHLLHLLQLLHLLHLLQVSHLLHELQLFVAQLLHLLQQAPLVSAETSNAPSARAIRVRIWFPSTN
jgi:hypothetical protein